MGRFKLYCISICSLLLLCFSSGKAQTNTANNSAGQARFIVFTGSDWCPHCRRFEKNILEDSSFKAFAAEHLEVVIADFPQTKKLAPELVKQNEALAEQYNPDGIFPRMVLVNAGSNSYKTIAYSNQSASEFIALLSAALP